MTRFSARGHRVYLRTPERKDLGPFLDAVRRSRVLHRRWAHPPADRVGFERYLRQVASPRREGLLVCREEDDALVGVINVSEIVRGNFQSAYLGFYALVPHAGAGLAAAANEASRCRGSGQPPARRDWPPPE